MRGLAEAAQNRGEDPNNLYTPEELAKWQAGTEPGYKSYDYYDMVMRKNVPQYLSMLMLRVAQIKQIIIFLLLIPVKMP